MVGENYKNFSECYPPLPPVASPQRARVHAVYVLFFRRRLGRWGMG